MKHMVFFPFMFLMSCNTLPQLYQAAEDVADDNAVKVIISREAINKETDIGITIDVKNNQAK